MKNKSELSIYRIGMQIGFVVLTFLIGLRHLLPGESSKGGAFDAFCPFGGIETMWSYITTGQTLKTTLHHHWSNSKNHKPFKFFSFDSCPGSLIDSRACFLWVDVPLGNTAGYVNDHSTQVKRRKDQAPG
jgi:hypothetical protein